MKPLEAIRLLTSVAWTTANKEGWPDDAPVYEATAIAPRIAAYLEASLDLEEWDSKMLNDAMGHILEWGDGESKLEAKRASYRALMEGT